MSVLGDPAEELEEIEPDGEPGPWVIADFDGPCSRGCQGIAAGEQIRADGTGEWECQSCVEEDSSAMADVREIPDWATEGCSIHGAFEADCPNCERA